MGVIHYFKTTKNVHQLEMFEKHWIRAFALYSHTASLNSTPLLSHTKNLENDIRESHAQQ